MFARLLLTVAPLIVLIALVTGCNIVGPHAVKTARAKYNVAVQQTNNEQVLLNLVRLKYRDTPLFIEINNIVTQFELETWAQSTWNIVPGGTDRPQLLGRVEFMERPTINYRPVQGEKFVRQILTPIDLKTILLLYHSGWSADRLFRVTAQSLNGISNARTASGPTPDRAPTFEEFAALTDHLRDLQMKNAIHLGVVSDDNGDEVQLRIDAEARTSPSAKRLFESLNLDPDAPSYTISQAVNGDNRQIAIVTRSLMAIMFYLSQGVEVPDGDLSEGRVTRTVDKDGKLFDWTRVTGDLLRVRTSERRPDRPYVTVRYRGAWFYIDDRDLESKTTFALLTQLLALQSGHVPGRGPVLTVPVGN